MEIKDCGICDNCLRKKRNYTYKEEFEKIHIRIIEVMTKENLPAKELLQQLVGIKKEKLEST